MKCHLPAVHRLHRTSPLGSHGELMYPPACSVRFRPYSVAFVSVPPPAIAPAKRIASNRLTKLLVCHPSPARSKHRCLARIPDSLVQSLGPIHGPHSPSLDHTYSPLITTPEPQPTHCA